MTIDDVLTATAAFAFSPMHAYLIIHRRRVPGSTWLRTFLPAWVYSASISTFVVLILWLFPLFVFVPPAAIGFASSLAVALVLWWLSRLRKRKRALKQIGAKARALRAKLVRSMPRKWSPPRRLAPQGA